MKKVTYYLLTGIISIIVIFLLSNIQKGISTQPPTRMEVVLRPGTTLEFLQEHYKNEIVVEDWERKHINTINVPPQRMNNFISTILKFGGVREVHMMPGMPSFSWEKYGNGLIDQVKQYANGDFGSIWTSPTKDPTSLTKVLGPMISRSFSYLLPALIAAFVLGFTLPILAVLFKRLGTFMDALHASLTALPDFFVVVLLQLFAVFISQFSTTRVLLIMQLGDEVPFVIPFITITLLPCILVYGTIRHAINREMAQPYISTALSKGLSRPKTVITHVLRNVMEDLLTIAPRAVTIAVSSMIMVEAISTIYGLGGYLTNKRFDASSTMAFICSFLAVFTIAMHILFALLRKLLVVQTKEVSL